MATDMRFLGKDKKPTMQRWQEASGQKKAPDGPKLTKGQVKAQFLRLRTDNS